MYLAVFCVQQIDYVNARYGSGIGDTVLLFCSQAIATRALAPADLLFRCRGPSFCAIVEREEPREDIRATILKRIGRVEFESPDGLLLLCVAVTSEVFPIEGHPFGTGPRV
jgi:GGDEF domain-containing protein